MKRKINYRLYSIKEKSISSLHLIFRLSRTDLCAVAGLTALLTVALCLLWCIHPDMLWGSTMDWNNQHILFPEYFRSRFYQTGQFFPNLAAELGSGQNIYAFTYYGLFNPILLLSYLLPFVPMIDYIQCTSLLLIWCSSVLCYFFCKQHLPARISFACAILLLFAAPVLFHSHRHIMFVNYFPFLFWALFAVRRCQKKRWTMQLFLAAVCMLGSSFFFAVGGFCTILLYAIFLRIQQKPTCHYFLLRITGHLFFAGMACMCFLLPTALALLQGRSETHLDKWFWLHVLVPTVQLSYFFYQPYGIGLTITGLFAILACCFLRKKAVRFLAVTLLLLLCLPLLLYCINGFLYLDGKAYIPLLPLAVLLYGYFFTALPQKQIPWKKVFPCFFLLVIAGFFFCDILSGWKRWIFIGLVAAETFCFLCLLQPWKPNCRQNAKRILWLACGMQFVYCILLNATDSTILTRQKMQQYQNASLMRLSQQITQNDNSWYRVYNATQPYATANQTQQATCFLSTVYASIQNKIYSNFYYNQLFNETSIRNNAAVDAVKNPAYHILMGDKYRIDYNNKQMFGYEPRYTDGDYTVYENQLAMPIGYATSSTMTETTFSSYSEPEQVAALFSAVILPQGCETADTMQTLPKHLVESVSLDDIVQAEVTLPVTKQEDGYLVQTEQDVSFSVPLSQSFQGKLLLISMEVDNTIVEHSDDVFISINGTKNKLTAPDWKYYNHNQHFTYLLSDVTDKLDITLSAGTYSIQQIQCFTLPETLLQTAQDRVTPLKTTADQARGDTISGTITTKQDGWFVLTVPYDMGFTATVDGNPIPCEQVNLAFLGFPLSAGTHEIVVTYHAPGTKAGMACTIGTDFVVLGFLIAEQQRKKKQIKIDIQNKGD